MNKLHTTTNAGDMHTDRIAVTRETDISKNRKHLVNQASQWIQLDSPIIFMDSFKRHCFSYTSS